MENFFSSCLERFNALHEEIKKSIHGLDKDALDWVPTEGANSINILVTHLTASEKFWAVAVALGKESDRVRAEEFKVQGLTEENLVALLDGSLFEIRSGFETMTLDDLNQMRRSDIHDMDFTAAWAILHALEHTAQHVGHLQLTAQLWKER